MKGTNKRAKTPVETYHHYDVSRIMPTGGVHNIRQKGIQILQENIYKIFFDRELVWEKERRYLSIITLSPQGMVVNHNPLQHQPCIWRLLVVKL